MYKPLDSAVLTAADSFREIRYRSPLSNTQPFSESKVVLPRKPPKKAFKINSVHDSLIMTALTVSNNTFRMDGAIGHKVMRLSKLRVEKPNLFTLGVTHSCHRVYALEG